MAQGFCEHSSTSTETDEGRQQGHQLNTVAMNLKTLLYTSLEEARTKTLNPWVTGVAFLAATVVRTHVIETEGVQPTGGGS